MNYYSGVVSYMGGTSVHITFGRKGTNNLYTMKSICGYMGQKVIRRRLGSRRVNCDFCVKNLTNENSIIGSMGRNSMSDQYVNL